MRKRRSAIELFAGLLFVAAIAAGCSGPKVLPTTSHAPTAIDTVRIYSQAPQEYEILGPVTLRASDQYKWDQRGDANAAFDELKRQAAAKGANGLLLVASSGATDTLVTAGYHGEFYKVPVKGPRPVTAVVQAIFVHKP